MIERGGDYAFAPTVPGEDRGWVFCPEYAGSRPLRISPEEWDAQIFLFGPGLLPDSDFSSEASGPGFFGQENTVYQAKSKEPNEGGMPKRDDVGRSVDNQDGSISDKVAPIPAVHLGKEALTNIEVRWSLGVKGNPHLLIAGLPGMGKTTCLVNLCKQMVSTGIRPVIFSYHQDIDERLQESVGKVRFVDFDGLGFNPLKVIDRESRMAHLDVAGAMRDIFSAIYPELGDIQKDRIRTTIKESFEEIGWGSEKAIREPKFRRFLELLRDDPQA